MLSVHVTLALMKSAIYIHYITEPLKYTKLLDIPLLVTALLVT